MLITLASPIICDEIAQAIYETCGAEIRTCSMTDLVEHVPDSDAAVIPGPWYSAELANALTLKGSRCRWVQFLSAGYEKLDESSRPDGVTFSRVIGLWGAVTAEHAMALLLGLTRRIGYAAKAQAEHIWRDDIRPDMGTLSGSKIIVLGTGEVGSAIAARLSGFDAEVIGISRSGFAVAGFNRVVSMDCAADALETGDVLIIAIPYSQATRHIIDSDFIGKLKPAAIIINVSRGGVIDQEALVSALHSGLLAGAGLDVTDPEPLPSGDPLWSAPNTLITPHVGGGAPPRFYTRLASYVAENTKAWQLGEPLRGLIP